MKNPRARRVAQLVIGWLVGAIMLPILLPTAVVIWLVTDASYIKALKAGLDCFMEPFRNPER